LGTITSIIDVKGIAGLAPSFRIDGTQLAKGTSLGTINLKLTQCQTNKDIMEAYDKIGDFLSSNYTNVLSFQLENERLETENFELDDDIKNLNREINNLTSQVTEWKTIAGGKWDVWLIFLIGLPMGIFIILLIQYYDSKQRRSKKQAPTAMDSGGIRVHK
jgi:hypothetical protein